MLELARESDPAHTGSRSAFYARVGQIREAVQRATADAMIRFEGLPGEFLQVDWGKSSSFRSCGRISRRRRGTSSRGYTVRFITVQALLNQVLARRDLDARQRILKPLLACDLL